jgi:signal recognition particle receptor subunit beta
MASVNPLSRELVFKIVYYGPGLGGKTTTLEHIHATAKPEHRGKLVSLATPVDRTLYFDFLPVRLPPVRGMNVRLQLFTVPGQVYFNATRKLVLTGADGVVFVSDSQIVRADANLESLENLRDNLADQGRDIAQLPVIFCHNKRDLPDLLPIEELDSMLNPFGAPSIATSAKLGDGVYEALERICERVLDAFKDRLPELPEGGIGQSFEAIEGGLVTALRDASQRSAPPGDVLVARIGAGGEHPSIPPEPSSDPIPLVPHEAGGSHAIAAIDVGPASDEPISDVIPSSAVMLAPPSAKPAPEPPLIAVPAPSAAAARGVSFAALWPEGEQDTVREVEDAIARGRYWRAIELCESLVSRVLAGAAGLFGSSDAPRDPAVVPLLLGLDGRRYLAFRSVVREARSDGLITSREALAAYAFAIECRIARSSVHQGV